MLSNPKKRVVVVASDAELQNRNYYMRLWMAATNLNLPRRNWLDEIADAFLNDIDIVWPGGKPYEIPFVDDVFANDLEMRWLSDYFKVNNCGTGPRRYSYMLDRLRLIDLYFRIVHPHIAAHFGK